MSKQQSIDLATQLINAQQGRDDGEMVIVRSGRAFMKVRAFNAGKRAEALKNAHRKQRAKAELRCYPKFTPGMSTAEYVIAYSSMNKHGVLPGLALNTEPCALYENGALDFDVIEEQIDEMPPVALQIAAIPESAEGAAPWADVLASSVESIGAVEAAGLTYAQRNADRVARVQKAETQDVWDSITTEENSDPERDFSGTDRLKMVINARRLALKPDSGTFPAMNPGPTDAENKARWSKEGTYEIAATAEVAAPLVVVPAPPEYVALRTAARAARRAAVAAINTARVSSAQAASAPEVATDGADYSYLIPADGQHAGGVAAAKNIRLVLKNQFPGVKFKVTSDYSSVNVRWIDGPVTGAVDDALAPFDIGHSDSQSDYFYTERTRFSEKFGGVQYLFTHRELSESKINASINAVFGEDGPTFAEWEAGTPWAQVECKGSYRDAQMWDQYEWLSMVRRHAEEK